MNRRVFWAKHFIALPFVPQSSGLAELEAFYLIKPDTVVTEDLHETVDSNHCCGEWDGLSEWHVCALVLDYKEFLCSPLIVYRDGSTKPGLMDSGTQRELRTADPSLHSLHNGQS
ncbi:hypothetical protein Q8A67_018410 [Cirrhinus molitorella]|uniref:Uncharacterized protein n=1 Tax=Cirrhinus molitorella TaxID=172907 RepID=A0AA88TG45_9TELE|nr:hypothetical protein Q8A67_018410 [Cirrhinus molitorella]